MYRTASHALYLMHNLSTFAKEKYMYQQPKRHIGRKFAIGCGALVALVVLIAVIAAVANGGSNSTSTSRPTPTAQPTQAATPTPTTVPTKKPTPAPTHQPTQIAQLAITFTLVDSGDVAVHTLPGAALTIKVLYCSGNYATSQSLQGTVKADIAGDYIWNWNVETSCHGRATAYVTASLNGKTVSGQAKFTT